MGLWQKIKNFFRRKKKPKEPYVFDQYGNPLTPPKGKPKYYTPLQRPSEFTKKEIKEIKEKQEKIRRRKWKCEHPFCDEEIKIGEKYIKDKSGNNWHLKCMNRFIFSLQDDPIRPYCVDNIKEKYRKNREKNTKIRKK
jgi:hypothetical protein